ncbi:MAG: hypothetical protein ACI9JZ_002942 [Lentimonas sp.]|jgi:hypothetical protein
MGSPYTNIKLIGEKPEKLQKSLIIIILVGTFVISCAAIYTLTTFIRADKNTTIEVELPYGTLSDLTAPDVFTQAYLSVNCNATLLKNTQTIRVRGHMVNGDHKQAFSLIKKRPDRMLFTIDRGSYEMTFGVSNDTVWRRIRAPQHDDLFALVEGEEADAWLGQRRFFDRIISASLGEGHITGIEGVIWEKTDCLKVSIRETDEVAVEILVSLRTMYPIAELETLVDGTIKQTVFSDYRDIDGMPLPFNIKSSVNGEADSLIILDAASLNSGVLSKLFDIPEALLAK